VNGGVKCELLVTPSAQVRSSVSCGNWAVVLQSVSADISGQHVSVFGVDSEGNSFARILSKGKAVPLQARGGPEGSRKLRFPEFMTTAQDGGKVVSLTHRPTLPPGNTPGTHFC
jgi:hypothetical protein